MINYCLLQFHLLLLFNCDHDSRCADIGGEFVTTLLLESDVSIAELGICHDALS
jgi:hypothetical protein